MDNRDEKTGVFQTSTFSALAATGDAQKAAESEEVPQRSGPTVEEEARARIATLEREAKALGEVPEAALLFHEVGLLWEDPLRNPRNAAVAFQAAYRLAPSFTANVRAARRLFADVGNWNMVLQLLDAELASVEAPLERAGLLLDKAVILEDRLSRAPEAEAALRACLELEPHDPSLLLPLESAFAVRGDLDAQVRVLKLLAESLEDPSLQAQVLTTAGSILEARLERPEEAASLFREAFAIEKRDRQLLSIIRRIAARDDREEELIAALEAEIALLGAHAAPAGFELAKVHERAGRDAEALEALLAARRVAPADPLILSELAAIYERTERPSELADVLTAWASHISDEGELVAINLRLAALYEESLEQELMAVAPYQAIIARIPGHATALAGLGKLFHRMKNWEGLLGVYEAEIAASEDVRNKAIRLFRAAEVLEEKLDREDDAILRFNECLQLQPGFLPAQKALTRLYEKRGQWADLVAMYEQDLLQTHDREQIIATLNKIAILHEDRLNALDGAIECMRRILELAPDHLATLHNLARLLERAGRFHELLEVHELEASHANDTKQVLSLYHRNAEILDEQLQDRAGATAAYERLLQLSPSYLPALKALGRLYAQDGRWEDLIRMCRAEAEIAPSPEHAATLAFKVGELYEHRLGDLDRAIASYEETLMLAPSSFPAMRSLARIYRAQGAWEKLIEILRSESANRTDPAERANAVFQASAIWEEHLQRADMAIEGYQEVLRLTPGHASALRALERLHAASDDLQGLLQVLDRRTQTAPDDASKVAAYLQLAHLYLDRLGEPARAVQSCEAGLAIEAGHVGLLRTLERIRASDRSRRGELRLRLADNVGESRLSHALRLAASADHERTAVELVRERLQAAFAEDPADPRVSFALERVLRQTHAHAELKDFYARRLETVEAAPGRISLLLRSGDLAEFKLNDVQAASDAFAEALVLQPGLLPAVQGLRRTALKLGELQQARSWWEQEAEAARDPKAALEAWNGAARTARLIGDEDGAVVSLQKALSIDPLDPTATAALEDVLVRRGGAEDLAALHERRGDAKLLQKNPSAAADAYHTAAGAWRTAGDPARTDAMLEKALEALPSHVPSLELAAERALEDEAWAEAANAIQRRIQQGGPPATLATLHRTIGGLFQDRLGDPTRAVAHLQTVLSIASDDIEALERLSRLYCDSENWSGAAECLERLVTLTPPGSEQARHLVTLAEVKESGLSETTEAAGLYRRALEQAPGDFTLVDRLAALYEKTGNVDELVEMLELQAQHGDPARAAALRMKLSELYTTHLSNPAEAIRCYRTVLSSDDDHLEARVALAGLLEAIPEESQAAIDAHRRVLLQDPTRVGSLQSLFRLWLQREELDKAFAAAGLLVFFKSADSLTSAFYNEQKNLQLPEATRSLDLTEIDLTLLHPRARTPLLDVLRLMGDQLTKLYPPNLEIAGIDRRADRLRADHPVHRAVTTLASIFGVRGFDVYQARRGTVFLKATDPLGVCVGQEVVRKYNVREQRFLIGRAVMGLVNKTALLGDLSSGEVAQFLGDSVRIHLPDWEHLSRRNDEHIKQLRKAASRKVIKALEEPSRALIEVQEPSLSEFEDGLHASADRAGLLVCGDLQVAMNLVLREDPVFNVSRANDPTEVLGALEGRTDLRELMGWGLSEGHFKLRRLLGL